MTSAEVQVLHVRVVLVKHAHETVTLAGRRRRKNGLSLLLGGCVERTC